MNTVEVEVDSLPPKAVNYLVELLSLQHTANSGEPVKKWYLDSILDLTQPAREYSEDWAFAGEIIQREELYFIPLADGRFEGCKWSGYSRVMSVGTSQLDACMKAYIAFYKGTKVEVPEALLDERKPSPKI